jgi:hypothetical protein
MDDLLLLIQSQLEGELSAKQMQQLQARLRDDPAALETFVQTCRVDQQLRGELPGQQLGERIKAAVAAANESQATADVEPTSHSAMQRVVTFFSRPTPLSMTVAAMVIGAFIAALAYTTVPLYQRWASNTRVPSVPIFVAELSDVHNAVWIEGQVGALRHSQLVAGHRMELRQGLAEIAFRGGATVLLEGPAVLTLNASGLATLDTGRLTARIPPQARGFTIETKQAAIVDLGTEFGVGVEPSHATTVRVFAGRVVVEPSSATKRYMLLAGDSLSISADGVAMSAPPTPSGAGLHFIRELPDAEYKRVLADAKPLAWWRFDDGRTKSVADFSGHEHHGVFGGGERASAAGLGHAANLRGTGYIEVPEFPDVSTYTALSIEAWIRSPARRPRVWERILERDFKSGFVLALCPGDAPQFNLTPEHAALGINNVFAETPIKVVDGRWHHIVSVWNGKTLQVYADAQPGHPVEFVGAIGASPQPLRIGASSRGGAVERFGGTIDEVAIYDRAVTAQEIEQHYEAGKAAVSSKPAPEEPIDE